MFGKSSTSKIQRFHPPVSFDVAMQWLQDQNIGDGMIVLMDDSSITFGGGKFDSFDDLGDD